MHIYHGFNDVIYLDKYIKMDLHILFEKINLSDDKEYCIEEISDRMKRANLNENDVADEITYEIENLCYLMKNVKISGLHIKHLIYVLMTKQRCNNPIKIKNIRYCSSF